MTRPSPKSRYAIALRATVPRTRPVPIEFPKRPRSRPQFPRNPAQSAAFQPVANRGGKKALKPGGVLVIEAFHRDATKLFHAVTMARVLERQKDGEIFKWVRSVIDQWPEDSQYRKSAEDLMRRAIARLDGAKFEGDIKTTPRQIHHNILTSAEIDPTTEPWVSLIDLAIKDDDPTRVLIDCQHKTVLRHPYSDPALDRLALERANPKIIGCTLHRYISEGLALDDIDQKFKAQYCNGCTDKVPRPAGWSFF